MENSDLISDNYHSDADDQPANDLVLADLSDADNQPFNNMDPEDELANDAAPLSSDHDLSDDISTPSSNLDTTLSPSQAPSQAYLTASITQSKLQFTTVGA
jgi:hypothetical protein